MLQDSKKNKEDNRHMLALGTSTSLLSVFAFEHFSELWKGIKRWETASVLFCHCTL